MTTQAPAQAIDVAVAPARRPSNQTGFLAFCSRLWKVRLAAVGLSIVGLLVVCAVLAPIISPYEPNRQRLLEAHRTRSASIVRPVSNGRHGHPVIFHSRLFEELERADPARGAKPVLRAHAEEVYEVTVEDEGAFIDIDTREDYERWIGPLPSGDAVARK